MKKIIGALFIIVIIAGIVWFLFGYIGIQSNFTDNVVKEELPDIVQQQRDQENSNQNQEDAQVEQGSDDDENSSSTQEDSDLQSGEFQKGDDPYEISGKLFISDSSGMSNISLVDFEVTNGPDLFLYAVESNSSDNESVKQAVENGNFIEIDTLKGNVGDQNYTTDIEIDNYNIISIWCKRFDRNFGHAVIE
jgi:hypothetical protein